jgi:hypothetical protein
MKSTLLRSALVAAVVATAVPSFSQMPSPPMLNVVRYQVKLDRLQEFQDVEKQIASSYKKAAPADQFRVVYRDVVGNTSEFWVLTPLSKFADRDGQNPYNKMATEQERLMRTARLGQYIERVQTSIDKTIGDLTVTGAGAPFPPAWVRYVRVRVHAGKADEFISALKTDAIPALKKMNGATYRVRQTIFGGNPNDFTIGAGFEKWANLDDATLPKAMGEQAYRQLQQKMMAIEASVETYILRYQTDLSYYPGAASSTTTSR